MLYFPQLNSGSVTQFPFEKTIETRTVVNESWSGDRIKYEDIDASRVRWKLAYHGLQTEEWDRIRELMETTRGRLGTFVFLDPSANLLPWSEEFSRNAWVRDPLLTVTGGVEDPWATTRASGLANTGSAWQGIAQALPVNGTFQYAFSLWARSVGASTVRLTRSTANQTIFQDSQLDANWRRIVLLGSPAHETDEVTFAVRVAPGGQVDIAGVQVEAQLNPSGYKKTGARGGVYLNARFDQDELRLTSNSFEDLATTVEIISR